MGDSLPPINQAKASYYKSYSEYSKTLRTWFVAYGIGGPVVLLSNASAWLTLKKSGQFPFIGLLFLIGGALQVIGALLNKHAMWYLYFGEFNPKSKAFTSYKVSYWFSDQGVVEVLIDLATVVLFGWATWIAFSVIMNAPMESLVPPQK